MPAYWVARSRINDPVEYKKYTDRVPAIIAKFGGKMLARGGRFQIMEGPDKFHRFVVIEFPTFEQGVACFTSPEYNQAAAFRRTGAGEVETIMVDGGDATKSSTADSLDKRAHSGRRASSEFGAFAGPLSALHRSVLYTQTRARVVFRPAYVDLLPAIGITRQRRPVYRAPLRSLWRRLLVRFLAILLDNLAARSSHNAFKISGSDVGISSGDG
jgi:uncharacterized protein (DUF1330 family)